MIIETARGHPGPRLKSCPMNAEDSVILFIWMIQLRIDIEDVFVKFHYYRANWKLESAFYYSDIADEKNMNCDENGIRGIVFCQ